MGCEIEMSLSLETLIEFFWKFGRNVTSTTFPRRVFQGLKVLKSTWHTGTTDWHIGHWTQAWPTWHLHMTESDAKTESTVIHCKTRNWHWTVKDISNSKEADTAICGSESSIHTLQLFPYTHWFEHGWVDRRHELTHAIKCTSLTTASNSNLKRQ